MDNQNITPINRLYNSRENFTIIGLTGLAGSGCSRFAKILEDKDFMLNSTVVRKPSDIPFECNTRVTNTFQSEENDNIRSNSQLIFKREYTICYNFLKENYKPYSIVKYTRTVLLYTLIYTIEKEGVIDALTLKAKFLELMQDKYKPSVDRDEDFKKVMKYKDGKPDGIEHILDLLPWDGLYNELTLLTKHNIIDCINS